MDASWSPDELFRIFVLQQQQTAMVFLGKMVHPQTNEIVRDLDAARFSIDLLAMLETKTKGNLSADEERLLGQVLTTLRLNFVDEAGRKPAEPERGASGGESGGSPGESSTGARAGEQAGDPSTDTGAGQQAGDPSTDTSAGQPAGGSSTGA